MAKTVFNNGKVEVEQLRKFFSKYGKEGWLDTFLEEYEGNDIITYKETEKTFRFSFDGDDDIYHWIVVEIDTDENGIEDLLLIQLDCFDYKLLCRKAV